MRSAGSNALCAAMLVAGLGACSSTPTQPDGEPRPRTPAQTATSQSTDTGQQSIGKRVAAYAQDMVGVPYKYGGKSPLGFDCSGLVHYSYGQAGITVPRTSRAQLSASRRITLREARPGDLLFFKSRNYSHVAIYLGDDTFVHAPSTGKRVTRASMMKNYYRTHLVAVGRLL
jgi:cell wall-associated NlpC family hydrolase